MADLIPVLGAGQAALAPAALDLVTITTTDFATTEVFYDAAMRAIGLVQLDQLLDEEESNAEVEAAAWGPPTGPAALWLVTGKAATTGVHVRFQARSRVQVETFFHSAITAGGSEHAAPRRWTLYRPGEFNAIVRDPAGNLVEAVAAE